MNMYSDAKISVLDYRRRECDDVVAEILLDFIEHPEKHPSLKRYGINKPEDILDGTEGCHAAISNTLSNIGLRTTNEKIREYFLGLEEAAKILKISEQANKALCVSNVVKKHLALQYPNELNEVYVAASQLRVEEDDNLLATQNQMLENALGLLVLRSGFGGCDCSNEKNNRLSLWLLSAAGTYPERMDESSTFRGAPEKCNKNEKTKQVIEDMRMYA